MDKDLFAAQTQRNLAYLIIFGFFSLLILRGLGLLTIDVDAKEIAMLAATFWFMRQRPDVPAPGTVTTTPQTIKVAPIQPVEVAVDPTTAKVITPAQGEPSAETKD